jgi:hypothetical protein
MTDFKCVRCGWDLLPQSAVAFRSEGWHCLACDGIAREEALAVSRKIDEATEKRLAECYDFNVKLHEDSMSKRRFEWDKLYGNIQPPDPRWKEKPHINWKLSPWYEEKKSIFINCKKVFDRLFGRR